MTIKEMISEILETVRTINNKCPWFLVTYSVKYPDGTDGIGSGFIKMGNVTNKTLREVRNVIREKFFGGDNVSIVILGATRFDYYEDDE